MCDVTLEQNQKTLIITHADMPLGEHRQRHHIKQDVCCHLTKLHGRDEPRAWESIQRALVYDVEDDVEGIPTAKQVVS